MKKICILSAVNIRHMTLISLYTERLKRDGIDFDIIYMDKYGEDEVINAKNKYVFTNIINQTSSRIKKVLQYFKFKNFAIPILEKNQYDFIIVWNDIAIFMFAGYLARKWKHKFCLNIRDYCGEKNPYIYFRFKRVIKNAAFTSISSDGFRKFLPRHDYLKVHSFNTSILTEVKARESLQKIGCPIRITFIGYVRYFEVNKKLLDVFKNDERFELHYYGTHAEQLAKYSRENGILNVVIHDAFPVSATKQYIERTDLINNLYGKDSINLINAISIKLYYGIYNRTPILGFSGTYTAEIINKYQIGYIIENIDNSLPGHLFNWYRKFDFTAFNRSCEKFLEIIKQNQEEFEGYYEKYCK